jgi:hypothetical protein
MYAHNVRVLSAYHSLKHNASALKSHSAQNMFSPSIRVFAKSHFSRRRQSENFNDVLNMNVPAVA